MQHPLSNQAPPPEDGWYLVQGFPGDEWRRIKWTDGEFRQGLMCQTWWKWRLEDELLQ